MKWNGVIEAYRSFSFPSRQNSRDLSGWNEGNTPLIFSPRLSELGGARSPGLYQFEGLNPHRLL